MSNAANNYLEINRNSWNNRLEAHLQSDFYDMEGFLGGKNSLNEIELALLGDVQGKRILHLQCHFGQDTISLSRLGAEATGVDLSDQAIEKARELANTTKQSNTFICSDVYALPQQLEQQFDIVFTSYGTISWLPDLEKWANVIHHFLKPGGQFVFAEFHPVVWMFDDDMNKVYYPYFNKEAIVEEESGTYADRAAEISQQYVCWNHSIAEVVNNLIKAGLQIDRLDEYDYAPYSFVNKMEEYEPGKHRIQHMGNLVPLVYSILATKQ